MSNTIIQIKSSTINSEPANLTAGEIAYSYVSDRLFIGNSTGTGVNDVGGRLYVNVAVQAYNSANGAYDKANSANLLAFQIGEGLTTANATITASYDKANSANILAFEIGGGLTTANAAISAAYDQANTANLLAFAVGTGLNTVNISTEAAFGKANAANLLAFAVGEGLTTANAAIVASYNKANSANILAFQVSGAVAAANNIASSSYDKANSANILAFQIGGGLTTANASITAAYDKANAANILAFQTNGAVTAANLIASTAYDKANAANILAFQVGGAVTTANAIAVAAFMNANTKFSASGGIITGDVEIIGNLTLSGNTVFIDATRLQIDDPLIYLAGNNYVSDLVDIGFIGHYVNATGSNVHTGFMRDHESKEYYVFQGYDKEPTNNHIDPNGNNFTLAVLNADLKTSNLILGGVNTIPWITSSYDKANSANILAFQVSGAVTTANTIASSSYDKANSANILAFQVSGAVTAANTIASSAYNKANSANILAFQVSGAVTAANTIASAAYDKANSANVLAFNALPNTSGVSFNGNLNFPTGNVSIGTSTPTANLSVTGTANITGHALINSMNVVPTIQSAFDQANSAYGRANTGVNTANSAYGHANVSYDIAVAAFIKANTGNGGGGGGGNTTYNIRTVITDTTLTVNDNMLLVDGSANVTLPNAALNLSKSYEIKNINIGTINIVGIDNQLIDGYANVVIQYKNSTLGVRSVGSSWIIF